MNQAADRSLARSAGAVSGATMMSRVLGLARESVVAGFFGAGTETDAFNIAFRIPNLLRDLFAEGALSAAFVPTFTGTLVREGRQSAWRFANAVLGTLLLILGAATLLIVAGAKLVVIILASGFSSSPGKVELAAALARVMSPVLLFVALAAVMMGALNVFGRFFLPAFAPAVFNAVNITVTLTLYPVARWMGVTPIYALAMGVLAGVIGQFVVQLPPAMRLGYRFRPRLALRDPGVRRMAALMLPAVIGLAATQINIVVDGQFASRWEGAVSWLQYAFRLMYLPIGLIGVAIGTVSLTGVSRDAAAGDIDALRRRLAGAVRLIVVLALPATAGLIALREPIIRVLFQRGLFEARDTKATAAVLMAYAVGLAAYSCLKVVVPTFYALGDTATPVRVSFASVAIKIAASFALIPWLRYQGLALSTSLVAVFNVLVLWAILSKRVGGFRGQGVGSCVLRSACCALFMGVCCGLLWRVGPHDSASQVIAAAWLGVVVISGIVLTIVGAWALRIEEVGPLMRVVARRLGLQRER